MFILKEVTNYTKNGEIPMKKMLYIHKVVCVGLLLSSSLHAALSETELKQNIVRWHGATFGPVPLLGNLHPANLPKWYSVLTEAQQFAKENITLDKTLTNETNVLVKVGRDIGDSVLKLNYLQKRGLIKNDPATRDRTKNNWLVILKTQQITLERLNKVFSKTYILPGNKKTASLFLLITQYLHDTVTKVINEIE